MNRILIICVITACITSVHGQNSRLTVGFKLLPGMADSYYQFEQQTFGNRIQPRFTFNFGAQVIYSLKDSSMAIESGIYYADRGNVQRDFVAQYYYAGGDSTSTSDIYLHSYYLVIPVLFRFNVKGFYISAGPSIEYYLTTKYVYRGDENYTHTIDWSGTLPNFKFGFDINLGKQFRLTDGLNLFTEASFHPSEFNKSKLNNNWFFHLNYELGIGINYRL